MGSTPVQGTLKTYDAATRSGTLLTDDGRELAYDAAALAGSGLRLLRVGQRLAFTVDDDGAIEPRSIRIPTFAPERPPERSGADLT